MSVLTVKELFDFVTDATITEDNIDLYLEKAMTLASQRTTEDITEQQKVDEEVRFLHQSHDILNVTVAYPVKKTLRETSKITCIIISFSQFSLKATCISYGANVTFQVFKHSFIPRNLDEVIDFERDVILAKEGQTEGVCTYTCACDFKQQ